MKPVIVMIAIAFLLRNVGLPIQWWIPENVAMVQTLEEPEIEFPEATYIWNYFHALGYSDVITAAIIGNIMVECGGYTLDLQVTLKGKTHYGMCQWSKKYYPEIINGSLEEQCDYLRDTIQFEIDTFGGLYEKGFNYDSFLELTDARTAALAFSKCYERNGSGTYELRQDCAEAALEYFLSLAGPGSAEP